MPDAGQCSSAATSASWARSSARPTSRTIRASVAITCGDSMRQIASIALWTSVVAMTADQTTATPHAASRGPNARQRPLPVGARSPCVSRALLAAGHLGAQALLLCAGLGRELGAEVLGLEQLSDLELALFVER